MNEVVGHQQVSDSSTILELRSLELPPAGKKKRDAEQSPRKTRYERNKEALELQKLKLEINATELDQSTRPEKEKAAQKKASLELTQLELDLQTKRRVNRLDLRKAFLEIREKQRATRSWISAPTWDILKYVVAVVPVLVTAGTFYEQHRKDTLLERRQIEQDLKFKLDDKVIKLIGELSKKSADAVNAALLLPVYGPAVTRIIIPSLKADWSAPHLVGALVDVVAGEPEADRRREAAMEIVQRLTDQSTQVVKDFLMVPTDPIKRGLVKVHIEAFLRLMNQCATVCQILRTAVTAGASRIETLLDSLENARGEIKDEDLMTSIKELKTALAARPAA